MLEISGSHWYPITPTYIIAKVEDGDLVHLYETRDAYADGVESLAVYYVGVTEQIEGDFDG